MARNKSNVNLLIYFLLAPFFISHIVFRIVTLKLLSAYKKSNVHNLKFYQNFLKKRIYKKLKAALNIFLFFLLGVNPVISSPSKESNLLEGLFPPKQGRFFCSSSLPNREEEKRTPNRWFSLNKTRETFRQYSQPIMRAARSNPFKAIGLIGTFAGSIYWLYEEEKKPLLQRRDRLNVRSQEEYQPLFLNTIENSKAYQMRAFAYGKNKDIIRKETETLKNKTRQALAEITEEEQLNQQYQAWFPFNRTLKKNINDILKNQHTDLSIAHSLMQSSCHVIDDGFEETEKRVTHSIEKLSQAIEDKKKNKNKPYLKNEDKTYLETLAIALNIRAVAKFRKAYDKDEEKETFRKSITLIIDDLNKSLTEYDSANPYTYVHLSRMKSQLARYSTEPNEQRRLEEEAEAYIRQASNIAPNDLAILNEKGLFYMRKGATAQSQSESQHHYSNARNIFQKALKVDDTNTAVLCNLAALSIRDKNYFKDAYIYASKADALCPGDCDILVQFIIAAAHVDKCEEARFKLDYEYRPKCINDNTTLKNGSAKRQGHDTEVDKVMKARCENIAWYWRYLRKVRNSIS
jgi:hypothetical protein